MRFSSSTSTLRKAVQCHLSAMMNGQLEVSHQNTDPGMAVEVFLKRKIYNPFITHPFPQIFYWLVFAPLNQISPDVCFILILKLCISWEVQGQEVHPSETHTGRKSSADSYHKHAAQRQGKLFSIPQLKLYFIPSFHEPVRGTRKALSLY